MTQPSSQKTDTLAVVLTVLLVCFVGMDGRIDALEILWLAAGGFVGYLAAKFRGFGMFRGLIGGAWLGPLFGWLMFLASPQGDRGKKKCPHCAELVQAAAKVCKHCRLQIENANPYAKPA